MVSDSTLPSSASLSGPQYYLGIFTKEKYVWVGDVMVFQTRRRPAPARLDLVSMLKGEFESAGEIKKIESQG